MCSNVAGLMNGPVGNLVAMGVRALIDGASPMGPRSADARERQKKLEDVQEFYDSVEAHLRGTLRVLQPAVEIKKVLMGECRSAGNERPAPNNGTPIAYYTPQNAKTSSRVNNCPVRCCGSAKKSADKSELTRTAERSSHSRGPCQPSTPQRNGDCSSVDDESWSTNKCRRNDTSKSLFSSSRDTSAKFDRAACGRTTRNKTSAKAARSCHGCDANSVDDMLAVLPCKHVFCYPCLARGKYPRCRKCDKSFDMKNVTSL